MSKAAKRKASRRGAKRAPTQEPLKSKQANILPIKALKLGPTQFQAEVKRLQAEGRMPSLSKVLDVIAEVRAEYREKVLRNSRKRRKTLNWPEGELPVN